MTVTIGTLRDALRAQIIELTSPTVAGRPYAIAQQLVYQSCLDSSAAEVRPAAQARLTQLVKAGRSRGLATRWTSSRARQRLLSGYGEITALALAPSGEFVIFSVGGHVLWQCWVASPGHPRRLGQLRHLVSSISMSRDGDWFVTGDRSGAVVRWDLTDDSPDSAELLRHDDYVRAVRIDRGSGKVYSAGDDGLIACWHEGTTREIARLSQGCGALAVDHASGTLYSGHQSGEIWCWDKHGERSLVGEHGSGPVTSLAVADGPTLVSTTWDGVLMAWELFANPPRASVLGRAGSPLSAGLAVDNDRVITGTRTGRVLSWELPGTSQEPVVVGAHDRNVSAISAESGVVLTGGRDGFIILWDELAGESGRAQEVEILSAAVAPDGSAVYTGGRDGIYRWAPVDPGDRPPVPVRVFDTSAVAIAFAGDDTIVSFDDHGKICAWSLTEPLRPPRVLSRGDDKKSRFIWQLAAIPGAPAFLTALSDGRLLRWDLDSPGEPTLIGAAHSARIAVAPDGTWAVSAGHDRAVLRWSLTRPGEAIWLGKSEMRIRALAIHRDGSRVFSADDRGQILSWNATGGAPWPQLVGHHGGPGGGGPGGAGAGPDSGAAGSLPRRVKVRSMALADDGSWVASAADDGVLECLNLDGSLPTALQPVTLPANVFSLGSRLLVADRRGGLTMYDVLQPASFALPPATESAPADPELTLVIDQPWCNQIRHGRRLDFTALRADLCGDRVAAAVAPCSNYPALTRFRGFLKATGWSVPLVPATLFAMPGAVRNAIIDLAREASARRDVLLVSGDPAIRAAVATFPGRDRVTIIDDVTRWMDPA